MTIDDDYIYFVSGNNNNNIYRLLRSTGKTEQLTFGLDVKSMTIDDDYIYQNK